MATSAYPNMNAASKPTNIATDQVSTRRVEVDVKAARFVEVLVAQEREEPLSSISLDDPSAEIQT